MKRFQINKLYGYYEVIPKPTLEELRSYYEDKYYQNQHANYAKHYEDQELAYFHNKIAQKDFVLRNIQNSIEGKSLLEIGCGEGFALNYYHEKGWDVTGVDYSDFALRANHPQLLSNFKQGNVFEEVQRLVDIGRQFDVVWLDNVLEHVIDPEDLIRLCSLLTKKCGVLVVEVPNDYSAFQKALLESEIISRKYWESYPDHLAYFSYQSLQNLCNENGWRTHKILSDFPIEWYLPNSNSNYVENINVGKAAHNARMFIENVLHNSQVFDMTNLINFYENMAKIGHGRQLIGFFVKD